MGDTIIMGNKTLKRNSYATTKAMKKASSDFRKARKASRGRSWIMSD